MPESDQKVTRNGCSRAESLCQTEALQAVPGPSGPGTMVILPPGGVGEVYHGTRVPWYHGTLGTTSVRTIRPAVAAPHTSPSEPSYARLRGEFSDGALVDP